MDSNTQKDKEQNTNDDIIIWRRDTSPTDLLATTQHALEPMTSCPV